jgi:hypothetical protein
MNSNELADRFIQRFDGLLVNRGDFSREGLAEWFAVNVTQQPEDTPGRSYTPVSDEEVKLALNEYRDHAEYNSDETNMRAALNAVLYRRGSTAQSKDAVPLFGLAPFMADIIRDELRECDSDEWTPESLAEAIVAALREKAPQQAQGLTTAEVSALSYCVARAQLDTETLRYDVVKAAEKALERFK